jgi:hypothetical protein
MHVIQLNILKSKINLLLLLKEEYVHIQIKHTKVI